ncbi:mycofactocin-coupled SDR family oxidoreductase [Rhodococcus sp. IEGM 1408]|uniref:mycofactocin-coupled SDR family oxidoreductase n=1 Tax=Rhodococcus sp. IEGM 1408 TaxID=3082220 RepID=UPI002954EA5B|nr:mycofactocin-coupled SDR family oxidoreductase [Rhodococcus sp. IEGM 1408]MDV8001178.1 mycofactocin-coupled SDR family oxidoreductase [Rhodococcus sp. IEGM 1408]
MGDFDGKVVYITGIARGQGRKHAIRFAREGAKVIGMDLCASPSEYVGYKAATEDDLAQTVEKVEAEGGEILAEIGDVRDLAFQQDLVTRGVAQFGGRLDVVIANAGICNWGKVWEIDEQQWQDTIDINLTGYWKTLKATIPHMLAADNGGSIVLVSSVAGLKAMPVQSPYSASKYGVVGLAQTTAKELGEHGIRVNTIHPYGVLTPMGAEDPAAHDVFANMPQFLPHFTPILGMGMATTDDISDSVLFLASDASRTITASTFTVDMGAIKV